MAVGPLIFEESAGDELVAKIGDRRWRIRGFQKNTSFQQMRVNVLVSRAALTFVDSLDLYSARQRSAFVRQAVEEIGLEERAVKKDVGELLVALEARQDTFLAREACAERADKTPVGRGARGGVGVAPRSKSSSRASRKISSARASWASRKISWSATSRRPVESSTNL